MPILQEDIKLLKSAVMADTADGGGAMTGTIVVDGQSNNLFPDTSAAGRARGQVSIREVYGVAHTDDTDTLLGAHAIITAAPQDPLVHCTLIKAPHWGSVRSEIKEAIEKYVVKGPKLSARLYDMHYAGSLQIRLISLVGANFPAGGDAIVLVKPNGSEQYVRLLKVTTSTEQVAYEENGQTQVGTADIALCDLGQELAYDFNGPPAGRAPVPSNYSQVFGTNPASGAKFYGIKKLALAAGPGDYSAVVAGGIYTPIVPAATIETPIIDQMPLQGRASVLSTGYNTVTLDVVYLTIGPGTSLKAPTAIAPKSLSLLVGASTVLTDNGSGGVFQGPTRVGNVDYGAGVVLFAPDSPTYSGVQAVLTYKPATVTGATANSAALTITLANQGLSFTSAFEPAPAPGSFRLSYMAQNRWYDLDDDFNGKLAGADSSYGVGSLNYASGSMGVTLGAIPDVGSVLLAQWGEAASAVQVPVSSLRTRVGTLLPLSANTRRSGITVTWSRGGGTINYSAVTDASGTLTGDAIGKVVEVPDYLVDGSWSNRRLLFEPSYFPEGEVKVGASMGGGTYAYINNGLGSYQLTDVLPVIAGSFTARVSVDNPSSGLVFDNGGVLYMNLLTANGPQDFAVGTIDYASGAVRINPTVVVQRWTTTILNPQNWSIGQRLYSAKVEPVTVQLARDQLAGINYASSATAAASAPVTLGTWQIQIGTQQQPLVVSGLLFRIGDPGSGALYSSAAGSLRKGWSAVNGVSTAAGTVSSQGLITISSLPANGYNAVTWYNAAQNTSAQLVTAGVFRTASAPLKPGVMQLQSGTVTASVNDAGVISGGFSGSVDFTRGVVRWSKTGTPDYIDPADLSYNAVFLQYLPLDGALLGLETARLPLDGKVPIFRSGDLVVVHNTLASNLPNPVTKGTAYDLGRERIASVRVKDVLGVTVPSTLYNVDLDAGKLTVPAGANIAPYTQPLRVENRIEDLMLVAQADISGQLKFTRTLTHAFPAGTSYASSALEFGDLFSRVYNYIEQQSWTGEWSDTRIGNVILANFNDAQYPILTTNRGAITERWALIFTNNTNFRIIGETVGEIGTGSIATETAPLNPATGAPYFVIDPLGWGGGRVAGNVLRINTDACGSPFCPVRTVLQGPATFDSDEFTIAFRGDVDRP